MDSRRRRRHHHPLSAASMTRYSKRMQLSLSSFFLMCVPNAAKKTQTRLVARPRTSPRSKTLADRQLLQPAVRPAVGSTQLEQIGSELTVDMTASTVRSWLPPLLDRGGVREAAPRGRSFQDRRDGGQAENLSRGSRRMASGSEIEIGVLRTLTTVARRLIAALEPWRTWSYRAVVGAPGLGSST